MSSFPHVNANDWIWFHINHRLQLEFLNPIYKLKVIPFEGDKPHYLRLPKRPRDARSFLCGCCMRDKSINVNAF